MAWCVHILCPEILADNTGVTLLVLLVFSVRSEVNRATSKDFITCRDMKEQLMSPVGAIITVGAIIAQVIGVSRDVLGLVQTTSSNHKVTRQSNSI